MTKLLLIGALCGCGLVILSAATNGRVPVWVGTLVIGLVVLIPLAMQVWK